MDEEQAGLRLDKLLAQLLINEHSRERLQGLIRQGHVQVGPKVISKPSYCVQEGEEILLSLPDLTPIALEAQDIALNICFEDEHLVVLHKPAGMLTHPTPKENGGTLVNALLFHCRENLSGINGQIRPGIVHRLDRDTAGLLMVAKTDQAHRHLSEQLKAKTARREYMAIVQGVFSEKTGTVDAPIGRETGNRDKMGIRADGRPAKTHWEVLDRIQDSYSLIRLKLETGRTHQIRVHMASLAHPLVNDPLYGTGLGKSLKISEKLGIPGQLLQAVALGFIHPVTLEPMRFEEPASKSFRDAWVFLGGADFGLG